MDVCHGAVVPDRTLLASLGAALPASAVDVVACLVLWLSKDGASIAPVPTLLDNRSRHESVQETDAGIARDSGGCRAVGVSGRMKTVSIHAGAAEQRIICPEPSRIFASGFMRVLTGDSAFSLCEGRNGRSR